MHDAVNEDATLEMYPPMTRTAGWSEYSTSISLFDFWMASPLLDLVAVLLVAVRIGQQVVRSSRFLSVSRSLSSFRMSAPVTVNAGVCYSVGMDLCLGWIATPIRTHLLMLCYHTFIS